MNKALLAAAAIAGLTLAGCGAYGDKYSQPYNDAPRSRVLNNTPADVVTLPDGFSNLATKCDHGNRIYVAFHGNRGYASLAVVAHDASCGVTP